MGGSEVLDPEWGKGFQGVQTYSPPPNPQPSLVKVSLSQSQCLLSEYLLSRNYGVGASCYQFLEFQ